MRKSKLFPLTAAVLGLILAIGATGCTGGSQPAPPASTPVATESATVAPTAAAESASPTTAEATESAAAAESATAAAPASASVDNLTVAFPGSAGPACEDSVLQAINAQLASDIGVNVSFVWLSDYWNQLALGVAAGTEYDVVWAHVSTLAGLVAKQVYMPVDQYLQADGPDLIANTPAYVLKGGQVNGKQYAFPRVIPMSDFNNVYDIRGDLRVKYGLPPITTLDQLETYFADVKAQDPDIYPIVGQNVQPLYPVFANFYFPLGDGGACPIYVDPTDPNYTVKSFLDSDAFAQVNATVVKWAQNGWLPATTPDITSADSGFDSGKVACVPANVTRASERIDGFTAGVPGGTVETVLLQPNTEYIFSAGDNMMAVASTAKYPDKAVALINWIKQSQANYDLWSYGVEGTNYNLNGNAIDTSNISTDLVYSSNVWMWNDIRIARFSANFQQSDIDQIKNWDNSATITPFVGFNLDQTNISSQVSNITALMKQYCPSLFNGVSDIQQQKTDIMNQLNAAGLQDVIQETQNQLNAWIAANPAS